MKFFQAAGKKLLQRSMPPGDDSGPEYHYCATCRPCCSAPHGPVSITTAAVASLALILSCMVAFGCNMMEAEFHHCVPAAPLYGSCGTCHCIIEGEDATCPAGEGNVPRLVYHQETVDQWNNLIHVNPYDLNCDPYLNKDCETEPPQRFTALGETAVCAIRYVDPPPPQQQQQAQAQQAQPNASSFLETLSPTANSFKNVSSAAKDCPTHYETVTFASEELFLRVQEQQEENGETLQITHYGACGVCSNLQDLAVYVANPDLTSKGQECGAKALFSQQLGVECFIRAGYTPACAKMWMYNTLETGDKCKDLCLPFTFQGMPNNGPPPTCTIADCLWCDEVYSGPNFKKVAARTRRRSGLLSAIARPCDDILIVNHEDPCPPLSGTTPIPARQKPEPTCQFFKTPMGPFFYKTNSTLSFIDLGPLASKETKYTRSYYNKCSRFRFERSFEGFWHDVGEQLGAPWRASAGFAALATALGTVSVILTWSTTCAAFRQNFWYAMTVSYGLCSLFQLLSLVLFASEVCPDGGCKVGEDTWEAVLAGIFWMIACMLAGFTRRPARPGETVACGCCPSGDVFHPILYQHGHELDDLPLSERPLQSTGMDNEEKSPEGEAAEGEANNNDGEEEKEALLPRKSQTTRVTITETALEDGTHVTRKITVTADGAKTVEETYRKSREPRRRSEEGN
ncbi:expressed unknown protein [Seminavis robusta]|uniref:Uncharacterized protein n=1 Tax=Seminavis robusta TaxID=568900 RepID=A0A9N8EGE1_9STRA|nr:expressed unknown protein [Seminavis robusta]|eukprot:Sro898_g217650.1 n/a (684) ;mRNA; f:31092-33245